MTKEQVRAQITIVQGIAETIRAFGPQGIPSGHLYAMLMGGLSLEQYDGCINLLKRAGLVTEKNHLLKWKAP